LLFSLAKIEDASLFALAKIEEASLFALAKIEEASLFALAKIEEASLFALAKIEETLLFAIAKIEEVSLFAVAKVEDVSLFVSSMIRVPRSFTSFRSSFLDDPSTITAAAPSTITAAAPSTTTAAASCKKNGILFLGSIFGHVNDQDLMDGNNHCIHPRVSVPHINLRQRQRGVRKKRMIFTSPSSSSDCDDQS
jgi:hypothetical protein